MEQRRNDQEKLNQQQPRLKPPEMVVQNQNQNQQPPPPQKCPRCDSSNTKFCYYNNYSLSQPRYFCKACRRYWTHGGTLRNVPVGGGCRKSKRPKPSVPSPSASQPLPAALPSTALNSGQVMRPLPPIMSYGGGSFLSSLAAMQSLSTGINQGAAVNLGSGSGQYDANMALFQSLKPHQPPPHLQFQLQNDQYYRSEQNLSIPLRPPVSSWTQSFINREPSSATATATTTTSAPTSNFWSGATTGSSFNPDHWQDSNPGFDPSSQ